jgi:hypothetical protein
LDGLLWDNIKAAADANGFAIQINISNLTKGTTWMYGYYKGKNFGGPGEWATASRFLIRDDPTTGRVIWSNKNEGCKLEVRIGI